MLKLGSGGRKYRFSLLLSYTREIEKEKNNNLVLSLIRLNSSCLLQEKSHASSPPIAEIQMPNTFSEIA